MITAAIIGNEKMIPENIIIIGSGPSLHDDDVLACMDSGLFVIAINSTWKKIPSCNILYAGDYEWWRENINKITSKAVFWTCSQRASTRFKIKFHPSKTGPFNSGMKAIEFASIYGAKKILLLGFDCSLKNGSHWHGNHEKTKNPTPDLVEKWHDQFFNLSGNLVGKTQVINCSRYTELTCFMRGELKDEIAKINHILKCESPRII